MQSRPEITGLKSLVQACENELGCALPPGDAPEWKRRMVEISKIKARQKGDPRLTLENLVHCLDYCLGHDIWPKSAVGITYVIDDALRARAREELDRVDEYIGRAIAQERENPDLFSETWINKLSRVQGGARQEVLDEWRRARAR